MRRLAGKTRQSLKQNHRLPRQIKSLPALDIPASHHIVHADHIRSRFFIMRPVRIIRPARQLRFLRARLPANWKSALRTAMWAHHRNILGLFLLVVEHSLVHAIHPVRNSASNRPASRIASRHRANAAANIPWLLPCAGGLRRDGDGRRHVIKRYPLRARAASAG
jgi:hypothetical protein